jgi:hypothetical protein
MGCAIHSDSLVIGGLAARFNSAAPRLTPAPDAWQIERKPKTKGIESNV